MAGVDKTGRSKKAGRFAALPHRVLTSQAYGSLDLASRALLTELTMLENGRNNGSLWLSVRDAADRIGVSDLHVVVRAFNDLQSRGFIQLTREFHWRQKASETSRARCWRLTWLAWPEGPKRRRAPLWTFEQWQIPAGSQVTDRKARKRANQRIEAMKRWQKAKSENRFPVVDFTTMEGEATLNYTKAVRDFTTANPKSDAKPPFSIVEDSTAHTDVTRGSAFSAWWLSQAEAALTAQILSTIHMTRNRTGLARAA